MTTRRYISAVETARLVREKLKATYPTVAFSVTTKTYAGGASLRVRWTDGPTTALVEAITRPFVGSTFDPTIDLKSYVDAEHNGERVHFGADHIFCERGYSVAHLQRCAQVIADKYGCAPPPVKVYPSGEAHYDEMHPDGQYVPIRGGLPYRHSAAALAREEAQQRSRFTAQMYDRWAPKPRTAITLEATRPMTAAPTRQIDADVRDVLSRMTVQGNVATIMDQLSRDLYVRTNAVLVALGGKWNRKAKGHVFEDDPSDQIEMAVLSGSYIKPADYGDFPTPTELADELIERARLAPGLLVLEPSAGDGRLAERAAKIVGSHHLWLVELQERHVRVLRANFPDATIIPGDFMDTNPAPLFHRVIMNPPFAKRADVFHVLRAYGMLKDGGRLVAIMSAGVTFRQDAATRTLRDLIASHGEIISNRENAFAESGTNVRTVTVILDR